MTNSYFGAFVIRKAPYYPSARAFFERFRCECRKGLVDLDFDGAHTAKDFIE